MQAEQTSNGTVEELPLFDLIAGLSGGSTDIHETDFSAMNDARPAEAKVATPPAVITCAPSQLPLWCNGPSLSRPCWGSQLTGKECTPDFTSGTSRFKFQFCPQCQRDGILLKPARVRVLPQDVVSAYQNPTSHGMWASKSISGHTVEYRVINHTSKCRGDSMLILREESLASVVGLPSVPQCLLDRATGDLHLVLSRGTLVPAAPTEGRTDRSASMVQPFGPATGRTVAKVVVASSQRSRVEEPRFVSEGSTDSISSDEPNSGELLRMLPRAEMCEEPAAKRRRTLLTLTSMHAQLGTQVQAILETSKTFDDDAEDFVEYRNALQSVIQPLIQASHELSLIPSTRNVRCRADSALLSFPASPKSSSSSLP